MMIRRWCWYVDIDDADMTWGEAAYAVALVLGAFSLMVLVACGFAQWLGALT